MAKFFLLHHYINVTGEIMLNITQKQFESGCKRLLLTALGVSTIVLGDALHKQHKKEQQCEVDKVFIEKYNPDAYDELMYIDSVGYVGQDAWRYHAEKTMDSLQRTTGRAQQAYAEAARLVDSVKIAKKSAKN